METSLFAYTGCYTTPDRDGRGDGINAYRIGPDGHWTHIQHIGGLENPSLFTLNRAMTRLYAVHGGRGLISAFSVDRASGHQEPDSDIAALRAKAVSATPLRPDRTDDSRLAEVAGLLGHEVAAR